MSVSGIRRSITYTVASFMVAVMASAPVVAAAETNVDMLYVKNANETVVKRVKEWAGALQQDFDNRSAGGGAINGSASAGIRVQSFEMDTPQTAQQLRRRWEQRLTIQVVYALGRDSKGAVDIEGTVFLGDFHGELPGQSLPFSHTVSDRAFKEHRNFLLAVTYYAMGNNALSRPAVACELFNRANLASRTLPASLESASAIKAAVNSSLKKNSCGTRRGSA